MNLRYRVALLFTVVALAFSPKLFAQPVLIHYWNFNTLATAYHNPNIPSFAADYSVLDTSKARVVYTLEPGTSSSYAGYIDNVASLDTSNLHLGAVGGQALRVRNPSDSIELRWLMPTTGYKNIVLKYVLESSSLTSGMLAELFDYSPDGGTTWKNMSGGLTVNGVNADTLDVRQTQYQGSSWGLVTITFGADTSVNNNANLIFRVKFRGNISLTSGNNRFDDISVEGDPLSTSGGGTHTMPKPASSSHTAGAWSSNQNVKVTWSAVTGTTAALTGYSYVWDNAPETVPDLIVEGADSSASTFLNEGKWYFHVRGIDIAGVGYPTAHFGPVNIDTGAPHAPLFVSSVVPFGTWSAASSDTIHFGIMAADTAGLNDLLGYAWSWTMSATTVQDSVLKGPAGNASTASLTDGNWYLHVRAADSAHNWSNVAHFGPLRIDRTAPNASFTINGNATKTTSAIVALAIAASDSGSGVENMEASNDGVAWTSLMPYAASWAGWDLRSNGGSNAAGWKHVYLHVFDSVGNVSNTVVDSIQYTPSAVNEASTMPSSLQMNVFPNPASSSIRMQLSATVPAGAAARIYDMIGREVIVRQMAEGTGLETMDVSSLQPGVYMLRVTKGTGEILSSGMIRLVK